MSLYQPRFQIPNNSDISATDTNIFSCQIQGTKVNAYKLSILNNDTNALVYNPAIVNINSTPLYNGDTLSINVPNTSGMTNGNSYKWKIDLYQNYPVSATPVTSNEVFFRCHSNPIINITNIISATPLTSKSIDILGSYQQAENVDIKWFQFDVIDSEGNLINTSGKQYSANIHFLQDGLISGNDYSVNLSIENQHGTLSTIAKSLYVDYQQPLLSVKPQASIDYSNDSILVQWSEAYSIPGVASTPLAYNFYPDHPFTGTNSLNLYDNNTITYNESNSLPLSIPDLFTVFYHFSLPLSFTGNILELENTDTSDTYTISYDGTKFTYQIGAFTGEHIDANATGDDIWWKLTLLPTEVLFKKEQYSVLYPSDTLYPADDLYPIYAII